MKNIKLKGVQQRGENSFTFTVSYKGKRYYKTYALSEEEKRYSKKQLTITLETAYIHFKNQVISSNHLTPTNVLFKDFVNTWRKYCAEQQYASTTIGNHLYKLEAHILPVLGDVPIKDISSIMIIKLMANLQRRNGDPRPLAYGSKKDIYKTLKSVFNFAYQLEYIQKNVMDGVPSPKKINEIEDKNSFYEESELPPLLEALQFEAPHWRIMFTLALSAGMRRGELLALKWQHIDFINNSIQINQSYTYTKNGPNLTTPKSKASERVIQLPSSIMNEIKEYKEFWSELKAFHDYKWENKNTDWVFFNEDTGKKFYPTSPSQRWKKFIKLHNLRYIRLHDLRHTSATLLIAQGVHAKIISERLGHSDISTTMNIYGHTFKSAHIEAADTLEKFFKK